jgi:hypothetical protein
MNGQEEQEGPGWAICPECDKKVKTDNLERHLKKVHGISARPARRPPKVPFPLGKFIAVLVVVIILVLVGIFAYARYSTTPSEPAISLDRNSHDFGTVSPQTVYTNFSLSNNGDATLEIYNISTSCDCTQAVLTYDGQTSPTFARSGNPDFRLKISPGKTATMMASIDPNMYVSSGKITRYVYFNTNDKGHSSVTITLMANIIR